MAQRFQIVDRETAYLFPPSVQDWLPEKHLARFVVDVVEGLALPDLTDAYAGRGTAAYPPKVLVSLLFYGSMAMPPVSSRAANWNGRPTIRWRFGSLRRTRTRTTTRSRRFGSAFRNG